MKKCNLLLVVILLGIISFNSCEEGLDIYINTTFNKNINVDIQGDFHERSEHRKSQSPASGAGADRDAAHGAAADYRAVQHRPQPAAGLAGARRWPVAHVLPGDAAAVDAGRHRRLHAGVHPLCR